MAGLEPAGLKRQCFQGNTIPSCYSVILSNPDPKKNGRITGLTGWEEDKSFYPNVHGDACGSVKPT
jgi:hypothetical protein